MKAQPLLNRITLAAIAAGLGLASCNKNAAPEEKKAEAARSFGPNQLDFPENSAQLESFKTTKAVPAESIITRLSGRLAWDEDHTIRVFTPVAGRVEKITTEIGQRVKKGGELATLRSPDFGQAQADYRKALSDIALADKTLARQKALLEKGAAAVKDVESAEADYEKGMAEKQRAEAKLKMLGTTEGGFQDIYHVISPIDGVIVDRHLTVGQEIRSDIQLGGMPDLVAPLFTVTDPSRLWLILDVPEALLSRVKEGTQVTMKTSAYPGREFPGIITLLSASLDPVTRVGHARAEMPNPNGMLRAEMYVGATVGVPAQDPVAGTSGMQLPSQAVFFLDGRHYLFVEKSRGHFERREVKLEREMPGSVIVPETAVHRGEAIVSEGGLFLNDMLSQLAEKPASPDASS